MDRLALVRALECEAPPRCAVDWFGYRAISESFTDVEFQGAKKVLYSFDSLAFEARLYARGENKNILYERLLTRNSLIYSSFSLLGSLFQYL